MTASIEALRDIILDDENNSLHSRMAAAEQLLLFEAPADAAELAKGFLTDVFEDDDNHVSKRLEALKIIRRAEARKVTQPTSTTSEGERREAWRSRLRWERQWKIVKAGIRPLPKGWAADLESPDFVPPDGEPPRLDAIGSAESLGEARQEFLKTKRMETDEPDNAP